MPESDPVRRRPHLLLLLLLVAVVATALRAPWRGTPARAALAERLDLDQLVERAHSCVVGTVIEAQGRVAHDGLVETVYRLRVDERPFGPGSGAFETVVLPGGVLPDGSGLAIPGLARFAVGERALLFLTAEDPATARRMPVGLDQGQWRLLAGPGGRTLAIGGELGAGPDATAEHGGARALDYAELRARIEAAVQRTGRGGGR